MIGSVHPVLKLIPCVIDYWTESLIKILILDNRRIFTILSQFLYQWSECNYEIRDLRDTIFSKCSSLCYEFLLFQLNLFIFLSANRSRNVFWIFPMWNPIQVPLETFGIKGLWKVIEIKRPILRLHETSIRGASNRLSNRLEIKYF